jgi:hypothetical protein
MDMKESKHFNFSFKSELVLSMAIHTWQDKFPTLIICKDSEWYIMTHHNI